MFVLLHWLSQHWAVFIWYHMQLLSWIPRKAILATKLQKWESWGWRWLAVCVSSVAWLDDVRSRAWCSSSARESCSLRQVNHFVDEVRAGLVCREICAKTSCTCQPESHRNKCNANWIDMKRMLCCSFILVESSRGRDSLCSPFLYYVEKHEEAMSSFVFGVGFRSYVTCACPLSVL